MNVTTAKSRLLLPDVARVGSVGLRTRRLRGALSALGIAIGVAAMVAVLAISASSEADLLAQIGRYGNILTATPGNTIFGEHAELPTTAVAMVKKIASVSQVSAVGIVSDATVRRNQYIPKEQSLGITVMAARSDLPATVGATLHTGRFLNDATARYPAIVLGAVAAQRLGIDHAGVRVWLATGWFSIVGVLEPVPLNSDLDRAAFVGFPIAKRLLGFDGAPTKIYVRTTPEQVDAVRQLLPATANPEHPEEVNVSRPTDALAARAAAKTAFTALFLGLGLVALVVGTVGIANVMIISVLERRTEVGLRRALGARKMHIATQFLTEAVLMSLIGGMAGVLAGVAVTVAYTHVKAMTLVLPPFALAGSLTAAVITGVLAGVYPALRAARLAPAEALRTV